MTYVRERRAGGKRAARAGFSNHLRVQVAVLGSTPLSICGRILCPATSKVRDRAKVVGRWHDNRHTLVTELAESGAGDEVIMSIAGTSRSPCSRATHTFEWTPSGAPSTRSPRAGAPPTRSARRRPNSGRSRRKPSQQWSSDFLGRVWATPKPPCVRGILRLGTQNGHGELNQRCPVAHAAGARCRASVHRLPERAGRVASALDRRFCRLPMSSSPSIRISCSASPSDPVSHGRRDSRGSRTIDCTLRWVGRYPGSRRSGVGLGSTPQRVLQ